MTKWKLVSRTLVYYWRTNLAILFGAAVSIAILTGALLVGDSVQYSLKQLVVSRLGRTEFALDSHDRFFRQKLANAMAVTLGTDVAPLIRLNGIALSEGGKRRVNQVQVLGVDERFFTLSPHPPSSLSIPDDTAMVNHKVASQLGVKEGDTILLRVEKMSMMPREAPLSSDKHLSIALPLTICCIASDEQLGRFSLRSNQVSPYTIFISISQLAKKINLPSRANMMLIAQNKRKIISKEMVQKALRKNFTLKDAGLNLVELPEKNMIELRSNRVFIEKSIIDAASNNIDGAQKIVTYFINQFKSRDYITPYSFVSAPGKPLVPPDMRDDEILINEWLAQDLHVSKGDSIELTYYVAESMRKLVEKKSRFSMRSVVPIEGAYADKELMPQFPGLADIDNCRDWDPGVHIDLHKIRTKDEEYWNIYKGIPKAFITLQAASTMWENRFGTITSIRYPRDNYTLDILTHQIMKNLRPSLIGFVFNPVWEEGIRAGTDGVDFGQLFIGLSFFIIIAALLLLSLLFIFGVEHRLKENGILCALGFSKGQIKWLLLFEGGILALFGGALGILGAVIYTKIIIYALGTVWRGTVGTSHIRFHINLQTLSIGFIIGVMSALLVMWIAIQRQSKRTVRALLNYTMHGPCCSRSGTSWISSLIIFIFALGVTLILVLNNPGKGKEVSTAFFMAGSFMLICVMGICHKLLTAFIHSKILNKSSLTRLAIRNCSRKRGRSLATIGIMACGIFLVFSVAGNRHNPLRNINKRKSGTGGFILYGETTLPILHDLNTKKGKEVFGLNPDDFKDIKFVHIYVREGDDASCLNLNRVQKPRIFGIPSEQLSQMGAFTFEQLADGLDSENPWMSLTVKDNKKIMPAIADHTVIVWGLDKSIGDTLTYRDENGNPLHAKLVGGLANSIFQGNILISQEAFKQSFPSLSGYHAFLVDGMKKDASRISGLLSDAMMDRGLSILSTEERLEAFNKVEATYLSIYLALGGLGLVLGSIGMGIVLLRNVLERWGELALLRAVGFSHAALLRLLFYEHGFLLCAGLMCGLFPSFVSLLPALASPGGQIPWIWLGVIIVTIIASGSLCILLATMAFLRRNLLIALRTE